MKQVSRSSGISSGFRVFFIFSAILALTSSALAGSRQLTSNPSAVNFGSVQVGSSQTQSLTLKNGGSSKLTITQATPSLANFALTGLSYPVTLYAGQSVSCSVTFNPQAAVTSSGSIAFTFHDRHNNGTVTMTEPVSGTGVTPGQLTSALASLGFGSVTTGSSASLTETLTNSGATSVAISAASTTGSGFNVSGLTLPTTLTAGQSVSFSIKFSPTAGGSVTGNLAITSNASNPTLAIPLSGTGVAQGTLGSNPTSLNFGSVTVGSNQSLSETVTNTGGSSVTISQATISGTGFSLSGISTPLTLAAGQSATFSVAFAPQSAASSSGNVTITSTASNPTLTIPVTGTGVTQGTLGSNPTSLSFGNVTIGSNQSLSETVTNTGGSSVTISQAAITGTGFSLSGITTPLTLTAGQSTTFSVKFAPTSAVGASGNVTLTSTASNPTLTIPVTGNGVTQGTLGSNPSSLNFGSVTVGSNQSLTGTVTNTGGSSVTISQATISGTGFSLGGITTPLTLTAGQSTTFTVSFAPQSAGSMTGSLLTTSNASNPTLSVALTGAGTGTTAGQLAVAPSNINFGSITIGTTLNQTGTLSAASAPVTVSSLAVSGSQFSVSGISLPVTIAAGSSVSFQVTFTPQVSGASSANATFTSNASNSPTVESLTGSGTAPQYSVSLGWNTSTSSDVAGYNIYRATVSTGPFTRLNSSLDATPYDTDSTVTAGLTYYYTVTAVSTSGSESAYSNQVQVTIPTP